MEHSPTSTGCNGIRGDPDHKMYGLGRSLALPTTPRPQTQDPKLRFRRDLEHPFDGASRALDDVGWQFDARRQVGHAIVQLLQRVHFHETTFIASTIVGWRRDENLAGTFLLKP